MGQIISQVMGNFVAVSVGLAVLGAVLIAMGFGQGAAFVAMLLGTLIMYHVGVGHPVDAPEQD